MRRVFIALTVLSIVVGVVALGSSVFAVTFQPSVGLPGFGSAGQSITIDNSTLGDYILAVYSFSVYAGGVLAAIMILVGGFLWLTAAGNVGQIGTAKTYVGGALSGLVLLLMSWVLLNTINPALVKFPVLPVDPISRESLDNTGVRQGCNMYQQKPADTQAYTYRLYEPAEQYCGYALEGYKCYCEEPTGGAVKCCYQKTTNSQCPGMGICYNDVAVVLQNEACPENTESLLRPPGTTCAEYIADQNAGVRECSSCAP